MFIFPNLREYTRSGLILSEVGGGAQAGGERVKRMKRAGGLGTQSNTLRAQAAHLKPAK